VTLRTRVLLLAVGSAAAVLVLFCVPVALLIHQSADEGSRTRAAEVAQGAADYVSTGSYSREELAAYVDRINQRDDSLPVTVVLEDRTSVGADQPQCADPDSDGDVEALDHDDRDGGDFAPTTTPQYVDVKDGRLARITSSLSGGVVTVCAFLSDSAVRTVVVERLALLTAAAVAVLAAVGVLALLESGRLIRHLSAAATTADYLADGDLASRVEDQGPPEVRRLGAALNRLAGRIEELLRHERETVADLSHRLRTPLAAVRLDVESLPDSEDKAELEERLAVFERTLTSVIAAARRPQREGAIARSAVASVVQQRVEYWAPLLEDQGRTWTLDLDVPEHAAVKLAADDLATALDALLENVIAHTDDGTPVQVTATIDDDHVLLDVRDRGNDIPPAALERGSSDRGSSGLGLDIARSCAEASGGQLLLLRDGDWKVVRLELGLSQPPLSPI
jgi:signal transduction histidine kinase